MPQQQQLAMSKSNKEKAVEVKTKGNTAFTAGKFKEAIEFYTEAIKLDPTDHVRPRPVISMR